MITGMISWLNLYKSAWMGSALDIRYFINSSFQGFTLLYFCWKSFICFWYGRIAQSPKHIANLPVGHTRPLLNQVDWNISFFFLVLKNILGWYLEMTCNAIKNAICSKSSAQLSPLRDFLIVCNLLLQPVDLWWRVSLLKDKIASVRRWLTRIWCVAPWGPSEFGLRVIGCGLQIKGLICWK